MMTHLVLPSDVNLHGRAHGGMLLRLMDTAAYVCASRHAGSPCVTASVNRVDFQAPIRVGDLVTVRTALHWVGRTSMVVGLDVAAEDICRGVRHRSNTAQFTMVAVDKRHRPVPVPRLALRNAEERARFAALEAARFGRPRRLSRRAGRRA